MADRTRSCRLRRRELGDRASSLGNGMLGQLTGENQTNSSLDLTRRNGALLVVAGELRGLGGDALENVLHERVEDSHGLVRDTSVRVHLLEHTVNVGRVGLLADLARLLLVRRLRRGLRGLLGTLSRGLTSRGRGLAGSRRGLLLSRLGRHCDKLDVGD